MKRGANRGFTIIELLVVIAIIALLASVIFASLNSSRTKAKRTRAQAELQQLLRAFIYAQGERPGTLRTITGNGCSDCPCRNIGSLANISESHACYVNWINVLVDVEAVQSAYGISQFRRDPWGSPYLLDENEQELNQNDCRYDDLRSAGSDAIRGTSDDIVAIVPHAVCP